MIDENANECDRCAESPADCKCDTGECQACGAEVASDERFCAACEPAVDDFVGEEQLVDALIAVLECGSTLEDESVPACTKARTFRDVHMLTNSNGLVVTLANGQVFHLTVQEG